MASTAAAPAQIISQAVTFVDSSGRLVIPSRIRAALGIEGGGELMMTLVDGQLNLYSKASARKQARLAVRELVKQGESMADELSAEREAEAQAEE